MTRKAMASIPLIVVSAVITLTGMGVTVQGRLRQAAHQALARSLALREAVAAGESAVEEAVFRMRHPPPGGELLDPSAPLAARIEPAETRRLIPPADGARITVGAVSVRQFGALTDVPGRPMDGTLTVSVDVRVTPSSLFAPAIARTVVRSYRVHVHRVRVDDGSGAPRVVYSQVRLRPRPLNQWVVAR